MIVTLILLIQVLCLYLLYRNNKVYYFSTALDIVLFGELKRILNTYKDDDSLNEDEINHYNSIKEKTYALLDKHSYNKYLFSFKPFKLEKWFTEEELKFIKYLKQYRK